MTTSIWRLAHLALALISALFLIILSVTGVILAFDAVKQKIEPYKVENLSLAQSLPVLSEVFTEITEINVNHNGFVSIQASDAEGEPVHAYIDPSTGKILGEVLPQSDFIQWTTALHRSLFLKETGRVLIGVVSFLLMIIAITGFILVIKRQAKLKHFFKPIQKDSVSQYYHVVTGRWALIPIFILAFTGTYLFMVRIGMLEPSSKTIEHSGDFSTKREWVNFEVFQQIQFTDVDKIEFPFIEDDPEEHFILKLKNKELVVSQVSGEIVSETIYSTTTLGERWSLDWHTGRTSILWAVLLGFASLNILYFIYSGFDITWKRRKSKIKNRFSKEEAETILLVGSENGSTQFFANKIIEQYYAKNKSIYLTTLNQIQGFPQAKRWIILTSTYGLGDAPSNANQFLEKLENYSPSQSISYTVVGFGSRAYTDYCAFAYQVSEALKSKTWAKEILPIATVNDKSTQEWVNWVKAWNVSQNEDLSTTPAKYEDTPQNLSRFEILDKKVFNDTFILTLKPLSKVKFSSGDLLAIYPKNNGVERLYSIGKVNGNIQLVVKLFPNGLCSSFLYVLKKGQEMEAKVIPNVNFRFPKAKGPIAMIANGTGIAPFLGMITENKKNVPIKLYSGFRFKSNLSHHYQSLLSHEKQLQAYTFAYSREEEKQYVMDLIRADEAFFREIVEKNGTIMICGSLAMQKDVETVLRTIDVRLLDKVKSDCY